MDALCFLGPDPENDRQQFILVFKFSLLFFGIEHKLAVKPVAQTVLRLCPPFHREFL